MSGKVYIVGAGPGAADLLTLRAASLLQKAEVVLHDDLVSSEILALCPASAEIISVGKRCGQHSRSQEQINALMVWHAGLNKNVVRLKSGDPAVFGRLGEELDALRRANIAFEIVPGITAASAAAASVGITLTDRHAASALMIVTAHNIRGEKLRADGFDPQRTSFAVYMPGPDYNRTARELRESGVPAEMPCVLVSHAGRSSEQRCFTTLMELPRLKVAAPALLIVGEVARQHLQNTGIADTLGDLPTLLKEEHSPRIEHI
ncbi:MAG TPA: uroporphyrinogen-III C-methyltransferase [Candidatus Angelobacter sp.]|nr:uroporphyrinogen-III C-methyltransferase [Candidatus Angelobacter sp.]